MTRVRPGRGEPAGQVPLTLLVSLLCVVSGSLDAISFLALGAAFASVMTGNIVFLGVAAGTSDSHLAISCGVAIAGYATGVGTGSWLVDHWRRGSSDEIWPLCVTKTLGVQLGVLLAVATTWGLLGGPSSYPAQMAFLAGAAGAMGIQGSAIRAVGVPVSTTYMTGAFTTLLEAVVTRRPFTHTETSAARGVMTLAMGALLGSLALTRLRPWALLVPATFLALVIGIRLMVRATTEQKTRDLVEA